MRQTNGEVILACCIDTLYQCTVQTVHAHRLKSRLLDVQHTPFESDVTLGLGGVDARWRYIII